MGYDENTVAIFSNFMNHHQLPLCKELFRLMDGNFVFVATEQVPEERLTLGYHDLNKEYPFILRTYESKENERAAEQIANRAKLVVIGSAPEKYIINRIKNNMLTFRYSERIYKKNYYQAINPRAILASLRHHTRYYRKNIYMLCASAYTASDFALHGSYINKTYKWGYFPEIISYEEGELLSKKRKNEIPTILWVGRFLDWKYPDVAIKMVASLKKKGYECRLKIVGTGPLEDKLRKLVRDKDLIDDVFFMGSMSPESVRNEMLNANIFLFTSGRQEGWGAVLNEAMNSGCAVICNRKAGAVPYMVEHERNGLIYDTEEELIKYLEVLIKDEARQEYLGENAYITCKEIWSPQVAAERLLKLAENLNTSSIPKLFESGPCSKAKIKM